MRRGFGFQFAALLGAAVCALALLLVFSPQLSLSIVPGAEGLNIGVYGFMPAGGTECYSTAQTLPTPYSWVSRDVYNPVVKVERNGNTGQVAVEIGTAWHDDPVKTVRYYVKVGETADKETWKLMIGQVVPYYVDMQVYVPPRTGVEVFRGDKVWLTALTVKWDRAITDPSDPSKSVMGTYSIPLGVYIDDYQVVGFKDWNGALVQPNSDMLAYAQLTPSMEGRFFTLYSEPSDVAALTDLYQDPQATISNLNQSLAGDPRPDTRFRTQVYFCVNLNQFGTYTSWNWWRLANDEYYPSAKYTLKVLYLQLGEYVFTIDKGLSPDWVNRNSTVIVQPGPFDWISQWWKGVLAWFASPLNLAGTFIVLGIALMVAVLVFLFLTGLIVPLRAWSSSRSRPRRYD